MLSELKVGLQSLANGAINTLRGDKTGALVTSNAHGQFNESAVNSTIMYATNLPAGVTPGTALTTAPPLTLWNPPSSGKNLSVTKVSVGFVSGTLGAGCIALAANNAQPTVPTGGTEIIPLCSMLGMPRGVGRAFTGSTITAVPTLVRPVFNMGAFVATTPIAPQDCDVLIDGAIIVTPGASISLQGIAAAGTTPLVILGITYEEIPV